MVSTRSSALLLVATASALALQNQVQATPCDADNYSKVAAAVQTLHANCASWTAYLANGGVWTCDSTCRDAVVNLVDTLPDCTFGGPYGQNYKDVVEGMVATCNGAGSDKSEVPASTTATPSATTSVPSATTSVPSATTAAPTASGGSNSTETAVTDAPAVTTKAPGDTESSSNAGDSTTSGSTSATGSAGVTDTPATDVSTTSGASSQAVASAAALVLVVAGSLLQ